MLTRKEAWRRFKRDRLVGITPIIFLLLSIIFGIFAVITEDIIFILFFIFTELLTFLSLQHSNSHSIIIDKLEEIKK